MVRATFLARADGRLMGFRLKGHAMHGEFGSDIVCAAISALCEGIANGLEKVVGLKLYERQDDGLMEATVEPGQSEALIEKAQLLLSTLELALNDIKQQYPECIRLDTKQWR